jgi:hypothetical protein
VFSVFLVVKQGWNSPYHPMEALTTKATKFTKGSLLAGLRVLRVLGGEAGMELTPKA